MVIRHSNAPDMIIGLFIPNIFMVYDYHIWIAPSFK